MSVDARLHVLTETVDEKLVRLWREGEPGCIHLEGGMVMHQSDYAGIDEWYESIGYPVLDTPSVLLCSYFGFTSEKKFLPPVLQVTETLAESGAEFIDITPEFYEEIRIAYKLQRDLQPRNGRWYDVKHFLRKHMGKRAFIATE